MRGGREGDGVGRGRGGDVKGGCRCTMHMYMCVRM